MVKSVPRRTGTMCFMQRSDDRLRWDSLDPGYGKMERVCVRHASQICPQMSGRWRKGEYSKSIRPVCVCLVRFGTNSVNRMIVSANWSGFMGIRYLLGFRWQAYDAKLFS
jgi:hypothetical protein